MDVIKKFPSVTVEDRAKISAERLPAAIGFSLMLAWHYLILFSPAFGDMIAIDSLGFRYIFYRQLSLYISLAICFYMIWVLGKWGRSRGKAPSKRIANIPATGIVSMIVGAAFALSQYLDIPIYTKVALIGGLGILQAYMMTLWMRCLMKRYNGNVISSFGIFMIAGGSITILISLLQWPIEIIGAIVLPGLSSIFLTRERLIDIQKDADEQSDTHNCTSDESKNASGKEEDASAVASAKFAQAKASDAPTTDNASTKNDVAKASSQGSSSSEESEEDKAEQSRLSTRNKRMILFAGVFSLTIGLMQGAFITVDIPILMVDNTAVLLGIVIAGILLYFIPKNLGITLSIDMMHRFSVILFVIGCVTITWYPISFIPVFIAQIALLTGFNLFDFGMFAYGIEGYWNKDKATQGADSGRPVVYLFMSSGLLIGNMMISNLPNGPSLEQLLVICGLCIILVICTTLLPFMRLSLNKSDTPVAADENSETIEKKPPMILSLSSFPTETSIVEDADIEGETRLESPWKNACRQIAEQYRLSPRETQIFMLVAKGRNADYIQSKLIISTHTAKTHIANIYHKLAIHSAQELLDLVEEQREHNE